MKKRVGGPLTEEDMKKLDELLHDEDRFEKMVDRAVRGMWGPVRRAKTYRSN